METWLVAQRVLGTLLCLPPWYWDCENGPLSPALNEGTAGLVLAGQTLHGWCYRPCPTHALLSWSNAMKGMGLKPDSFRLDLAVMALWLATKLSHDSRFRVLKKQC